MDVQKLGSFIRDLRKEKEMTQKDLGEQVGVSDKAVSKWERGLSFPDITLLPILANALNVTVGEIINGERNVTETINLESVEKVVDKTMEYSKQSYSLKMKNKYYALAISLLSMVIGPIILVNIIISLNGITRIADYSSIIGIPIFLITSVILFIIGRQTKI